MKGEVMRTLLFFALPFALACGDTQKANGEHCTSDDECESGFCHIMTDEAANHCMDEGSMGSDDHDDHDDMDMGDSGGM